MQLPKVGEKMRCAGAAFEHNPAPFSGRDRDRDGVVGQCIAASLGDAQSHGFVVPVELKVKAGKSVVEIA